ncbi:MAG: hypothetical protein HC904_11930 [Blastochloris sp.]|nr:hypothetical protein [Blastochloris sp.]
MNVLGPAEREKVSPPSQGAATQQLSTAPLTSSPPALDMNTEIKPHSLITSAPQTSQLVPRPEEARQIIDLLRSGFLDSASLISMDLNEQNVSDLMTRFQDKVKLSEEAVFDPDPRQNTLLEMLPHQIAYWRPAELSPRETQIWITQWEQWRTKEFAGLILDLRYFKDANDLEGAVSVTGLFAAPQTPLFRLEGIESPQVLYKTEHQPLSSARPFPLLVLVNHNTRGAGEALAWSLRQFAGAILIGQATAGEGGLFTETRLKSGRFLRMASARIVTAPPVSVSLLGSPIQPDIQVAVQMDRERNAFFLANRQNLPGLIAERPAARRAGESDLIGIELPPPPATEGKAALRDLTLQRAVDVLRGIVLSQREADIHQD